MQNNKLNWENSISIDGAQAGELDLKLLHFLSEFGINYERRVNHRNGYAVTIISTNDLNLIRLIKSRDDFFIVRRCNRFSWELTYGEKTKELVEIYNEVI